jgi:hypothetical protein
MTRLVLVVLVMLPIAASANMLQAPRGRTPTVLGPNDCKTVWVDQGRDNLDGTTLTVWVNVGC